MSDYKSESRRLWSRSSGVTTDDLKLGCLQRIADATEAMAKEHDRLLRDARWQREAKERAEAACERLRRSNAALRGVISKMKRASQAAGAGA